MLWKRLGDRLDASIASITERATRRMTRRDALRAGVVGSTVGLAALALGERPALAARIPNSFGCGPTRRCAGCQPVACPSGYRACKITSLCGTPPSFGGSGGGVTNSQGFWCEWPEGEWIAYHNLGHGHGYRVCLDCVKSPINSTHCHGWCTCLTICVCCYCKTVADVKAEMQRLDGLRAQ